MASNSYSSKIGAGKEPEIRKKLEDAGFEFKQLEHAFWRAVGNSVNVSFYKSGKILVQGAGTTTFVNEVLGEAPQLSLKVEVPEENFHSFSSWVGTDESGKGDYFGPLIIAAVYVNKENRAKLEEIGVTDSKKLKDKVIEQMAWKIKANATFSIVAINPQKYNQLYDKFQNLNKLLAWGHARAIENILEKTDCENALSDKFGNESLIKNALLKNGRSVNLMQRVRAESDTAVAAASIIARNEFVQRMKKLEQQFGIVLPKGASAKVKQQARAFVDKYGKAQLPNVAKMHFKTTNEVT